jgi:hypothetical protein
MHNYLLKIGLHIIPRYSFGLFSSSSDISVINTYLKSSCPPNPQDLNCIGNRQVFGDIEGIFAVAEPRCKHGFPQAFVRYPVGSRISSGMLRLSCPLLVKHIDEWEAQGGIEYMNLLLTKTEDLKRDFVETNKSWRKIKLSCVTNEQIEVVKKSFGEDGAYNILNSGIIGVSQNKSDDVKCLHAHTADYLLRGGNVTLIIMKYYITNRN